MHLLNRVLWWTFIIIDHEVNIILLAVHFTGWYPDSFYCLCVLSSWCDSWNYLIDALPPKHQPSDILYLLSSGIQLFPITFNEQPVVKENGCRLSPESGVADNTTFSLSCDSDAFTDDDEPFTYSLSFYTKPTDDITVNSIKMLGPCE